WIWRPEELPKGPFRLIGIGMHQNFQQVPRDAIRRYGEARNLVALFHFGCSTFDDSGLAAISACRELINLDLQATGITDAGLRHLSGMKYLARLDAGYAEKVNGSGLADVHDVRLTGLSLGGSATPAAVDAICRFKDLTWLATQSPELGDEEAERLL